ncbi:MAG: GxxExxY protein [Zoogloeaceae bacterium]|jgi:GxxExxY protein|nr:GxxExxY protein [Zoogloeaceae bacterium]
MVISAPPESEWLKQLSHQITHAAMEVHRHLGPGLVDQVYAHCLREELHILGLEAWSNVKVPIRYKAWRLEDAFTADLQVENAVLVGVKSVDYLLPLHAAQLRTYLKLSGFHLGLLINFNVEILRQGIRRVLYEH